MLTYLLVPDSIFFCSRDHRHLHSFPTRRSSDLLKLSARGGRMIGKGSVLIAAAIKTEPFPIDRKSTRLNSSHQIISYAVFCLKKKKPTRAYACETTTHADYKTGNPIPRTSRASA